MWRYPNYQAHINACDWYLTSFARTSRRRRHSHYDCPLADCAAILLEEEGLYFPVVELGARFLRSARYDEELEVHTVIAELRRARLRFDYELHRPGGGEPLALGHTVHAAVDRSGRPVRIPGGIRGALGHRAGPPGTGAWAGGRRYPVRPRSERPQRTRPLGAPLEGLPDPP